MLKQLDLDWRYLDIDLGHECEDDTVLVWIHSIYLVVHGGTLEQVWQ